MSQTTGARVHVAATDGLAAITLDHPPLNILTRDVLAEMRGALTALSRERDLRALVLGARGKHFSAGASVEEHLPPTFETMIPEFLDTVSAINGFPIPVIAAVRGRCLGGGMELVLAADLVVAGEGAVFGQPEIQLGVLPPAACAYLPRRVPRGIAATLVYTGEPLDAAAAHRAGLVTQVVPDDDVDEAAGALGSRIARHSAVALRIGKRMLREAEADDDVALRRAGDRYTQELMTTADAVEGLRAFVEKRPAEWSHR